MRQARRTVAIMTAILLAVMLGPAGSTAVAHVAREDQATSSVWLPYWVMDAAVQRITGNSDLFRTASPFWYDARSCSTIVGKPGAGNTAAISDLRSRGLAVVPSITASGLPPRAAVSCFGDPDSRAHHIEQVVDVVRSRSYAGVDIDYENLALTTQGAMARQVRDAFSAFVEDLCARMRTLARSCVVTVMPRTSERLSVWRGKLIPAVYDYRVIGQHASRMRVMAYDQHASGTAPGPIAGFPWVRRIASYVARTAPLGKVELGVPTYGRDWTGHSARSLTGQQAIRLARAHGLTPRFDRVQRERTFSYRSGGARHTVWFSDPRAVAARHGLARGRGFAGSAYWAAGLEQAGTWNAVRRR